jgi:hypothetical protein
MSEPEEAMKEVLFKDIPVDTEFFVGDVQYKKIPEVRISCCSAHTAEEINNPNVKAHILPLTKVKVKV